MVCEAKVLVLDLLSKEVTELPKACFENKSPTCVSFLFLGGQVTGGVTGSYWASCPRSASRMCG